MKKLYLLTAMINFFLISFSQNSKQINKKGVTGLAGKQPDRNYKTPVNSNNTERNSHNNCYKNFEFTVKNYGYSKMGNHYSWGIKVKNNYTKSVSLRYKLIVGNDNSSVWSNTGTLTYNIKPGETYDNDYGTAMALIVNSSSDQYRIEVSDVCFEGQDCIKNGYADCNGNQSSSNSKSKTSESNKQTSIKENNSVSSNTKETDFVPVQIESEFPGGQSAWTQYLQRNLNANIASDNGAPKGKYTVYINFIVNIDGSITDVSCENDPGYGTCQEAIRILSIGPNWKPAVQGGRNVKSRKRQAISFQVTDE